MNIFVSKKGKCSCTVVCMSGMPERHVDLARFTPASPILLKAQLSRFTFSIISRAVLGKKYFSESQDEYAIVTLEEFQEMFDELLLLSGMLNVGGIREVDEVFAHEFDRFHDHVIDEHLARRVPDKSEIDFTAKDMEDLLLQLDLIAGGTDTSANTVEWPTCELLKQPNLTKKGSEELDRILVEEEDFPELSYLDAILKETMRLHPVAAMLEPHLALQD
ncbi:hypothetical protein RJ639_026765 [Escallonia herrerae]|uniref:Uncharacterized protein n=1 Tax=Escallonia herrerae TaxID=1293975 RepID=A0AA88XDL8_9ASTE|nr:hypothetical protein RJ639_026765 [Escallonia herrerae]